MNNKKVQAHMQIDVSFVANTTKLVKELENSTKKLNLGSVVTRDLATNLSKGFKEVYGNLDKMATGLSKKGLSSKQYTAFFDSINDRLQQSLDFTQDLKKSLSDAFNSPENKQAIKDLEEFKKQLIEINKLASRQSASLTRQNTAKNKLKDETGLDFDTSRKMLNSILKRRANKQDLTRNQQDWAQANGLDESKLKRALELMRQINSQAEKITDLNNQAKNVTGQNGVAPSVELLEKNIAKLENNVFSQSAYKQNLQIADGIEQIDAAVRKTAGDLSPQYTKALSNAEKESQKLAQASSTIKEIFAQFGIAFSAATIVRGFQDLARSAFDFYKSLDSALNEIYVVSNLSSDAVDGLQDKFINMAKNTGMALDDVTRSAVLFYQQGLNTSEVMEMTRVTSEFAKVAGIDATDAADKLTAAVNGYCLAAEDASSVADKFNKVAAATAADINELSTAFSKAAAQANQAGVSMDNYLAYIATMEEATREAPENIGTSLKTIFSRMQQIKTGNNTEDTTDVNQVETALKSVGIALRDAQGELRDLEEIFDELGPKWNSLDRNTQAYLGTIIAGTRQQSRFITLMQNWDRVLEVSEQSANSAGMQALMHAKAMDSIKSKLQQLQVAWQEFVSNLASSDLFKGAIEGLTNLIKLINSGNKPMILLAGAIALIGKKLKDLQAPILNKIKDFKNLFGGKSFTTDAEKNQALKANQEARAKNEEYIKNQLMYQATLRQQIDDLETKASKTGELDEDEQDKLNKLKQEELNIQGEINRARKKGMALTQEKTKIKEAEIKTKRQKIGSALSTVGMGISAVGMMSGDANTAGLLGGVGTGVMAAGQFATGNFLGGTITAITSVYQLLKTIKDWDKNLAKKISDAVDSVNTKIEDVNNKGTVIRSSNKLIEKYEQLSKKIVKTAAEQEQLNDIVQELGDTHGVDVVSDEYGNLLIDINEVKKKVEELNEERKKGIDELREQELEAIENATSGFMNTNKVSDYYEELFKTVGSKYRDLLADMDDGLTKENRNISETMSKTLMSNIKNELVENAKNHAGSYIESGIGKGLTQQQKAFNNLSSDAWNELYAKIGNVKEDLNSLTFNEVQERMNKFYDDWAKQNGIAEENLEALKKSVNDTLYGNSSIMQYYNQIDTAESKVNKTYYAKEKEDLKNLIDLNNYKTAVITKSMMFDPAAIQLMKQIALYDKNKTTRAAQKRLEEIKKEEQKELEKIAKEHGFRDDNGEYDTKGAEKWLNAQIKIRDSLKDTTAQTQEFLTSIKSFTDFDNLGPEQAEKMSKIINSIIPQLEQESTAEGKTNLFVKLLNEQLDNVDDEQLKGKLQDLINDSFNNLELPQGYTFTQIAESLDTISEKLITMNDLVAEFNDKGALTLDEFKDLAGVLDSVNPEDLFAISDLDNGVNYVNDYISALKRLDLAYDANNGMITMNGEALNDLRAIQEAQAQAQIVNLRNELVAKKTQVEAEIGYIDAQIAGTDAAIEAIKAHAESGAMGSDILTQADDRVQDSFSRTIKGLQENYLTDVQNMNSWTQAVLSDLSAATEGWGRYWKAVAGKGEGNLSDLKAQAKAASDSVKWEGAKKFNIEKDKFYNSAELQGMLGQMSSYRSSLENLKAKYQNTLELYNTQIGLLDSLKGADLSQLGRGGKDGSGSDNKLTQYIGKLKEIFNILNRIQVLEHRLSTLDAYADIAQGERYGNLLKERLGYNEELLDQYEFLTREQKQFTNGYKDFINSVEGLEGVFDFDQFGQIIINWDKYVALQDVAVDNEVTLKEKADDVYDTYTQMFTDLHGYFDKTIEYYKTVIELQQEMVDSYISIQNQVADAVKEIYKKILDTKLDAIDQEKDALDELKKARDRANKDTKNAQAVSDLQTNLQRAMMDTSGASDTAFIKSQKDIQNKLDEIAEDKYSTMLQDIQDKLDEEKDALQREFDDMFEQLDWLFQWIDDDIMGDQSMIYQILEQTDEWNQSSFLERQQKLDEWKTQFYTYYQSVVENERGIYGIYDNITSTKERIGILDSNLQLSISKGSAEIAQTLGKWAGDISSSINNLSSRVSSYSGGGGGGGYSGGSSSPSGGSTSSSNSSSNYVYISCADGYTQNVPQPKKVKKGSKFSPPSISRSGYTLAGWDVPSAHMCINAGGSFTATVSETIVAVWKKASNKSIVSNFGKWLGFDTGGLADFTGPAWLDGTKQHPEMVLNQLQTKHFINFANTLDKMYSNVGSATGGLNSSVTIGSIGFQVDSMSSPEDGEKAFNMFVDKFKEIGNQTGIKINSFKNTL